MPNLRLLFDDQVGSATISASTTAGSLVAAHVLTDDSSQIWRATGTSATLTLMWPIAVDVGAVVVGWANLRSAAVVISLFENTADAEPVVSKSVAADEAGTVVAWFDSVPTKKVVIAISGAVAAVQVGRVMVGPVAEFDFNPSYSHTLTWKDEGRVGRAESGAVRRESGPIYRVASFSMRNMTYSDAVLLRSLAMLGLGKLVFTAMFPGSAATFEQAWSFLATVTQDLSVGLVSYQRCSASLVFEEAL